MTFCAEPVPGLNPVILTTIERVLTRVNALSQGGPGWTRPSYSPLESAAHAIIEEEALALGMEVRRDHGGNLIARLPGRDPELPPIWCGSHLDTVAEGGAYDGQAGVAAALALVTALRSTGVTPAADFVIVVTRAEESVWFPVSYIGSRAATGQLLAADLEARRVDTGRRLADHMREEGGDPEALMAATPPAPARFLEFHIEQGPMLDSTAEPFGIVTAIRGGLRYRAARLHGVWAHSGGAPRDGRADAVVAFADLVLAMDRIWEDFLAKGADLTVTFGRVSAASPAHAMAKVAGELDFCLDLRSEDVSVLDAADAALKAEIARIEGARPGIRFDLGQQSRSRPAQLSESMAEWVAGGAARLGLNPPRMLSGGGHDAAAFATAGWESVMVFIRNWNGSHCPDEGMNPADLALAVEAVCTALSGNAGP
ncbi:hydantoinase/carbamoylase family amidase [Falsigemmobacter faecalis]|uniref:Hydantoinase/carbamoylase family amidase n=1 Tax=Falsigemmobacter faecalis TaxID=2488730 RepID=A0A3P3DPY1_9RHOB|nr:hydantoinase/carbamoylase family amidase [Falsigemmobacter faecalis]RRH76245.1 hydantoinase/carbamoylase family amidase [Falsigemmobacter faecalis]